jgi:CrcB protein
MFKAMFIAGCGGFLGTCLRFFAGKISGLLFATPFPYGTLTVNLVGCLLIGIFSALAEKSQLLSSSMTLFLVTGFCGGLTTFSSFSNDSFLLLQQRQWIYVAAYLCSTLFVGLLFVWVGRLLVKG